MNHMSDVWFEKVLALMPRAAEPVSSDPELLARIVANSTRPEGYESPEAKTVDGEVAGPHGGVPVRVYTPANGEQSGIVLVFCHGGGWIGGDLEMPEADATARELASRIGATVVSVQYRLALAGVHFP